MDKLLAECDVLAPRPATSSDDWPELQLSNVQVYVADEANKPCSLLWACENYPLTVTGQLNPPTTRDKDLSHIYRHQPVQRYTIAITNVTTFSYGEYDDGKIQIWAAGQAGWYAITPARGYRGIYEEMIEDVKMLYFVADSYKEERKAGKGRNAGTLPPYSAQELFVKYAAEVMTGSASADEAAEQVYAHRIFLLSSMVLGKEGMFWSQSPLFRHLIRKFPEDYQAVKERVLTQAEASLARSKRTGSAEASSSSSSKQTSARLRRGASAQAEGTAAPTRPLRRGLRSTSLESAPSQPEQNQHNMPGTPSSDDADSSDSQVPARAPRGKSILRPRPTRAAKGATANNSELLSSPTPTHQEDSSGRFAGKRKQQPLNGASPSAKRRNSRADNDNDEDIEMLSAPDDHNDASDSAENLSHVPDPVQEDTWICALDGCTHKVFAASQPDSQRLIREHYALHAYDDDERVQLVKKLQAPSLPVGHLMERVRQQAKTEGFPGSRVAGTRFPGSLPSIGVVQRY